ncbi:MAG: type IX secretion system membrane protein PorP/SprF [Bacteroidia bacterium]|nr:type IX secretion system membrane protein PorP/SprF [Bacteroidia bacterium]
MKKLLAVVAAGCLTTMAFAQQDPQFSQNMFNRLWVNPASAGSSEAICASLLYRAQWVSFDGAPKTGVFSAEAPLANNKVGLGLSINTDEIGFENSFTAKLAGAYRFDVGNGKLALGVDFGIVQTTIDGKFVAPDGTANDPAIPQNSVSGNAFDLGGGLYYNSEKLYIGVSSTHLLESEVDLDKFTKEYKRHYYGMIGYTFELTPSVSLKPMVFVKNVTDNTTIDVNVNAHFNNRFWAGLSWRNEDAIVGMLGLTLIENLRLGYAYDFTTSELKDYSDGTHEIMLGYCFNVKKKVPVSIRNVRFL